MEVLHDACPRGAAYTDEMMMRDIVGLQRRVVDALVAKNSHSAVKELAVTVQKLYNNLAGSAAARFRRVKRSNELVARKILDVACGEQWLLVLGWEEADSDTAFTFPASTPLDQMAAGIAMLAGALEKRETAALQVASLTADAVAPAEALTLLQKHNWEVDATLAAFFDTAAPTAASASPPPPPPPHHTAPLVAPAATPAPPPRREKPAAAAPHRRGPPAAASCCLQQQPAATSSGSAVAAGGTQPPPPPPASSSLSALLSKIDAHQTARSHQSHSGGCTEARSNSIVERLLRADAAGMSAAAYAAVPPLRALLAEACSGSAETRAGLQLNAASAMAAAQAPAREVAAEVRALRTMLGSIGAAAEEVAAIAVALGMDDGGGGGQGPSCGGVLGFVTRFNDATAREARGELLESLAGYAVALRIAKELSWNEGVRHALAGIASCNLALNSVPAAENAVRQRSVVDAGAADAPPASRVSALSLYGRFSAEVRPCAVLRAQAVASSAVSGLRRGLEQPPLFVPVLLFRLA